MESDSDDELMSKLAGVRAVQQHYEACSYCAAAGASVACTTCHEVYYCNEQCKRRHFKAHRAYCIATRMQRQESEESDESEEDSSDSEFEDTRPSLMSMGSRRRSSGRSSTLGAGEEHAAMAMASVPGLTQKQIKKLLDLSAKAESIQSNDKIDELQKKIAELMAAKEKEKQRERSESNAKSGSSAGRAEAVRLKDLRELEKKLKDLEKRTQSIHVGQQGLSMSAPLVSTPVVYSPLLVKDDDAFRKYFKLKDLEMPIEQIKAKMENEGVDPSLLDNPHAISPNDPGPPQGAYVPMTVGDDPEFKKYFKLKQMGMPVEQIKLKMEADGVDPDFLDHPSKTSPNDPGPPLHVEPVSRMSMPPYRETSPVLSPGSPPYRMSLPNFPIGGAAPPSPVNSQPYTPMLVKDDPDLKKYFKLVQMGMPTEQVKLKMSAEGLDPTLLDRPDDPSPNDPGPPACSNAEGMASPAQGPVSMEHLYSILMQHQQIIQQVSSGGASAGTQSHTSTRLSSGNLAPTSVQDQMAQELAAAESAIDDIFGAESSKKSSGGISMIEQLEKKARKESNKKIVEHRDEVNRLIRLVLDTKFESDEQAIGFYQDTCPKLDQLGLSLGVDAVQTWSARLLIKNRDTKDWYFSEEERLDAGKAYIRMWSLSFLERDAGQIIAKHQQILNAPRTLRSIVKSKPELIEKFTQLLKDAVKMKHKIFKNGAFQSEVRRLRECDVPERFEERGQELIGSATVLADAAMDLAEEEYRLLASTTRAKKIRAHSAVHVAERVLKFLEIVRKLHTSGINEDRAQRIEDEMNRIKEEYAVGQEDDEEEDDVL